MPNPNYEAPDWMDDESMHDQWHIESNQDDQEQCPWDCTYLGKSDVHRIAVVTSGARDLEQVQRFLPHNYQAAYVGDQIVITGEDVQGWGLDTYVLPRLASGLIYAREIHV